MSALQDVPASVLSSGSVHLIQVPMYILLWKSVKLKLEIHPSCHNFAMTGSYITAKN